MTEAEWVRNTDVAAMLEFLGELASDRKYRLFACACCRLYWHSLQDPRSQHAVEVAEQFADGLATPDQLVAARGAAQTSQTALTSDSHTVLNASSAAVSVTAPSSRVAAWAVSKNTDRKEQPALLREIFGNPFRPVLAPASWPATVTELAQRLYAGEACEAPLRQALQEAGQQELADHFGRAGHPKGCWAMDLLLGKEDPRPPSPEEND
jgi:hypothetical protein